MLCGGKEERLGQENLYTEFCISVGKVSNFFCHVTFTVLKVLKANPLAEIEWPTAVESSSMCDLVCGFKNFVVLLDGMKQKMFRPGDKDEQQGRFCGQHHFNCHEVFVWTDVFGFLIRWDLTWI